MERIEGVIVAIRNVQKDLEALGALFIGGLIIIGALRVITWLDKIGVLDWLRSIELF